MTTERRELVARIWSRDPTVWTGADEARWLGWLDEPFRMLDDAEALLRLVEDVVGDAEAVVLLGMGGSSLAPEVMRLSFGVESFHVLDTTHPQAIRELESKLDLKRTLFISASKSGSTLETRSHTDYFWKLAPRGDQWAAITDPGSTLAGLAQERKFAAVFPGEPTIGGRYSALSPFGIVPAALMGIDVVGLLARATEMADACRLDEGNPGLELGLALGEAWRDGRDKVCLARRRRVWLVGRAADRRVDRQAGQGARAGTRLPRRRPRPPAAGGAASGSARARPGVLPLGVRDRDRGRLPRDQPVRPARRAGREGQDERGARGGRRHPRAGGLDRRASRRRGASDYICIQAFVNPTEENDARVARLAGSLAERSGCVVTHGFGPRYLHSTGQLHKGGPPTGRFLQIVEDYGAGAPIPGRPFGFGRLIRAQAAGDFSSLVERGRRVARIRLEEVT